MSVRIDSGVNTFPPGSPTGLLPKVGSRFFLWLFLAGAVKPAAAADFIIVQHPSQLIIYNRYQQRVGDSLPDYTAMRIVSEKDTLSDGLTPAMHVQIDGQDYFLRKESNGLLSHIELIGDYKIFSGAKAASDSLEVIADEILFLGRGITFAKAMNNRYPLNSGDRLQIVFRRRGAVYAKKTNPPVQYGWIDLSVAGWRELKSDGKTRITFSPRHFKRLQEELNTVNSKLTALYQFFNEESGKQKPVPRWSMLLLGEEVQCRFQPPELFPQFKSSTAELAQRIQLIFGKYFTVLPMADGLVVTKKTEAFSP